ncbi:hypothetical protein JCGZ_26405 [Jatropha curcas]|uniref:Bidirectional sugar transporter SWEET n=1 Tax=Jatropha curcas TaxID=180498 RepID=A0A067JSR5_JATCU|nr:hypothetical protein JCGZ_26405 [Jatropha curcas]
MAFHLPWVFLFGLLVFAEDATLLITINSFTFFMEVIYITLYLFYAIKKDRTLTTKLILLFNVFGFGTICLLALFLTKGEKRVHVLGWICMIFSLCVFAAPLGIVRKVIKTKSVEFMPFSLSFFLTLSAVMWFFYGFLKKDLFVAVPNILGFIFGVLQMVLYMIYRNPKNGLDEKPKLHELSDQHIIEVATILSKLDSSVVTVEKKEDIQDQDSKKQNQKIKNQEKNNVFDTV